ncbi:MAG: Gmad2 immunoglobulin-like domain-containing protein [Candidatus Uhrbacteria bacterium]|nr:Gmad2 immunoglobulin-like domain-containing protein [Candidatus Uhrbacteria bacterium]
MPTKIKARQFISFLKKSLPIIGIAIAGAVIGIGFGLVWKPVKKEMPPKEILPVVADFEECAKAGGPIMESYPRQCRYGDKTFTEQIGDVVEKSDLIRLDTPRPNQAIRSPLTIAGEARGSWFFEASFPVVLTNWDGLIIAQGVATAESEWMTSDFVPFKATLIFAVDKTAYSNKGTLILRKDNPSGLPEHDDALEIPVILDVVAEHAPPTPKACTQEAKQCPDGSSVSRTGPNCEFTPCPAQKPKPASECTKDSDCPSSLYLCQEIQGSRTACPSNDPSCVPAYTIIKGECRLKENNWCHVNSDCSNGNVCNNNSCVSPIGRQCIGIGDTSCSPDFECAEGCGPPVVRYPSNTPSTFFCQLKGYKRMCPICLAKNTAIDTPQGAIPVQKMQRGDLVWTLTRSGQRVAGVVSKTGQTVVPSNHMMVRLVLDDGRTLFASPGHPTIDRRSVGDLKPGDEYDGSRVVISDRVSYGDGATYDILPSGETGLYFANGILLDSTLH